MNGVSLVNKTVKSFTKPLRRSTEGVLEYALQQQRMTQKPIQFELKPMILGLLSGGALLYQYAQENAFPSADPGRGLRYTATSFGAWAVAQLSKGVYPVWMLGQSIYTAGKESDAMNKLQAVVKTVTTMSLGYAGVMMGQLFTDANYKADENAIRHWLTQDTVQEFRDILKQGSEPVYKDLEAVFQAILDKQNHLSDNIIHKGTDAVFNGEVMNEPQAATMARKEISQLRSQAVQLMDSPQVQSLLESTDRLKRQPVANLLQIMRRSEQGYIKLIKMLNPVFMHSILAFMVGIPLSRAINTQLEQRFPNLIGKQIDTMWQEKPPPKNLRLKSPFQMPSFSDPASRNRFFSELGLDDTPHRPVAKY